MAFSYVIKGQKELRGVKLVYGTWDAAGATSGTITLYNNSTNDADVYVADTVMPYRLIGANVTNTSTASSTTATAFGATDAGTIVVGKCKSGDTGTWYALYA